MRFILPYNEILPKRAAHDLFLFRECIELSKCGHDVHLLCGKGDETNLFEHYGCFSPLTIHPLPIIRKNNFLNMSWNLPFFISCQKMMKKLKPDVIILSVLKQAIFHLNRRLANTTYIYEAHELSAYPNTPTGKHFDHEKIMMMQADRIIVTTHPLKQLLQSAPYNLKTPIDVIPLAVDHPKLPPYHGAPTISYVGQLYKEQGVAELIDAVKGLPINLQIFGGSGTEIAHLDQKLPNVHFKGFIKPKDLPAAIKNTTAFVAPFEQVGRMPYVAHTKLHEYAAWGRPIIAPNLPIVRDHFSKGVLLYNSKAELRECLKKVISFNELPDKPTSWSERIDKITTSL